MPITDLYPRVSHSDKDMSRMVVLKELIEHGWLPLRRVGMLLGYKDPRGVYARQKSRKPIPTVKFGKVSRVYAEDVINEMRRLVDDLPEGDRREEVKTLLELYHVGLRNKQLRQAESNEDDYE